MMKILTSVIVKCSAIKKKFAIFIYWYVAVMTTAIFTCRTSHVRRPILKSKTTTDERTKAITQISFFKDNR